MSIVEIRNVRNQETRIAAPSGEGGSAGRATAHRHTRPRWNAPTSPQRTPSAAICLKPCRMVMGVLPSWICSSIFSRSIGAVAVLLSAPAMPAWHGVGFGAMISSKPGRCRAHRAQALQAGAALVWATAPQGSSMPGPICIQMWLPSREWGSASSAPSPLLPQNLTPVHAHTASPRTSRHEQLGCASRVDHVLVHLLLLLLQPPPTALPGRLGGRGLHGGLGCYQRCRLQGEGGGVGPTPPRPPWHTPGGGWAQVQMPPARGCLRGWRSARGCRGVRAGTRGTEAWCRLDSRISAPDS